jgi:prepilin-type N-terminal cleavage/methylation domain-containing protein
MKKFKKLKGFTLIELIIVMAIFSVVMFSALQLITPVGNLFSSTSQYEGARSVLDNIKRYFDGTIRYADKVYLCREDVSNRDARVADFYNKYYDGNIYTDDSKNDYIYVLQFDNTQYTTDSSKVVTLYQYKMNYTTATINGSTVKVPSGYSSTPTVSNPINESLFGDYAIKFCLGQYEYKYDSTLDDTKFTLIDLPTFNSSNFCMTCDLYKNTTSGAKAIQQCTTVSVNFININTTSNLAKAVVTGTDASGIVTGSYVSGVDMFSNSVTSQVVSSDDNFFIIYTVPDKQ